MPDKEFDKRIRAKFEDFSFEPSAAVFNKVFAELDGKKNRKSNSGWWIAASISVLILSVVYITPETQHIRLYGKAEVPQKEFNQVMDKEELIIDEDIQDNTLHLISFKKAKALVEKQQKADKKTDEIFTEASNSINNASQQVSAAHEKTKLDSNAYLVLDKPTLIAVHQERIQHASNEVVINNLSDTSQSRAKGKIKSVGDLVNFVVGKVDKRKNKIIEFSNSQDGNIISGINLGLVQYKDNNE